MKTISFRITSFLLYFVSLLPFAFIYLLADMLYFTLYYLTGYRKKVVQKNLKNAFPGKTHKERKQIEKRFYRFLSDMLAESVKMLSISEDTMRKRFRLNNPEEVNRHFEAGKSVIMATGHYGNWEWGSLIASLAFNKQKTVVVYKPLTNKKFEELINGMRSRFGAVMTAMKAAMRKVAELRNETSLFVLVSDQTPARVETRHFLPFLNQPTAVFLGIEKIAQAADYPVVYCRINRIGRGYYEADFKTLTENPKNTAEYEITRLHMAELENIIKQKPELWLWSHKRWKYKPEDFK